MSLVKENHSKLDSRLIYDCEIENAIATKNEPKQDGIEYCAGWRDFQNMGISVICAYDYALDNYRVFCRDNFDKFQDLVNQREIIIGYNSLAFDNRLCETNKIIVPDDKSYDVLSEIWKAKGLEGYFDTKHKERYMGTGLDNMCKVNFGTRKSGYGALAPVQWQKGEVGNVIDYCLNDVKLTKQLVDQIIYTGHLLDSHQSSLGDILSFRYTDGYRKLIKQKWRNGA